MGVSLLVTKNPYSYWTGPRWDSGSGSCWSLYSLLSNFSAGQHTVFLLIFQNPNSYPARRKIAALVIRSLYSSSKMPTPTAEKHNGSNLHLRLFTHFPKFQFLLRLRADLEGMTVSSLYSFPKSLFLPRPDGTPRRRALVSSLIPRNQGFYMMATDRLHRAGPVSLLIPKNQSSYFTAWRDRLLGVSVSLLMPQNPSSYMASARSGFDCFRTCLFTHSQNHYFYRSQAHIRGLAVEVSLLIRQNQSSCRSA